MAGPPDYAVYPHHYRIIDPATGGVTRTTSDGVGNLGELKAHLNVEHTEDDEYIGNLLLSAQHMVGDYTGWPMRTGALVVEAHWSLPLPQRRMLRIPGPADVKQPIKTLPYRDRVRAPLEGVTLTGAERYSRLPHDATIEIPEDVLAAYDDGGRGEFILTYTESWAAIHGRGKWPQEVAHVIYRVAATLYR